MTGKRPQQDTSGNITVDGDIYLGGRSLVNAIGTTDVCQFAAVGSLLDNIPLMPHPAENLLRQAVFWIDSAHSSASSQSITNLGWGGSALNAQLGSTTGSDTNDPKYLDWQGENYVYLPGVSGNYLSTPSTSALNIAGDIDIRVKVALDDWTPTVGNVLAAKRDTLAASSISWLFYVDTNGTLVLLWSADGVNLITKSSTVATGVTDGAVKWVRVVHDVDNGASGNDVKFYTSDDGSTWTQLGTTVTTAGTTSHYSSTSIVEIGSQWSGTSALATGKFYRAIVKNGIDGTTVLDVDCSQITTGSSTSFTALTGQTVTINRATSGRKTVAVVHPVWLFGTDDYMTVVDNNLLDFNATDSFTVLVVVRQWATQPTTVPFIAKRDVSSPNLGWSLQTHASVVSASGFIDDGPNIQGVASPNYSYGSLIIPMFYADRFTQLMNTGVNGSFGGPLSILSVGSIANPQAMVIGVGAAYGDFEFITAAVFRRVLTAKEISIINDYYEARAE